MKDRKILVAQLSEEGLLRRRTFELMDGRLSLEGIAYRLAAEFPQRFSSQREALSYAGVVSQDFSRYIGAQKRLRRAQRRVAGREKFSKRWKKGVRLVAKMHRKVFNQPNDFQHKLSREIVNNYGMN